MPVLNRPVFEPHVFEPQLSRSCGNGGGRRWFLRRGAAALLGLGLASCARGLRSPQTQSPQSSSSQPRGSTGTGSDGAKTLRLYTWSSYIDQALTDRFTQETGIAVEVDIFDSNETMLAKLQGGGGDAYSLVYPSDYAVVQMVELDLLSDIDRDRIPAYGDLLPHYTSPSYDPDNRHSIPAVWGTTGFAVNQERFTQPIGDWGDLWTYQTPLKGKMSLLNDVREVFGASLKSLGFSYNATDPAQVKQAFERLKQLKPSLASFSTDAWREQVVAGDLLVAMAYSSDALELVASNPSVKYVLPSSGSSLWTDTMVIPRKAPNPEAAYQWINFVMQPEVNAAAATRLRFATPSQRAIALLPTELRENVSMFPPTAVLERCEGIQPLSDSLTTLYDRYWTELTA